MNISKGLATFGIWIAVGAIGCIQPSAVDVVAVMAAISTLVVWVSD